TRNPVLSKVEWNTRLLGERFSAQGIPTCFEMNPGNHFSDAPGRTARGIAWLVGQCSKET
ncbi:MAG: alpha/beta hydrolase, partial [Clostridia bacterium]|nr:alpha/beta hydrolase [Clostridia bacterium]